MNRRVIGACLVAAATVAATMGAVPAAQVGNVGAGVLAAVAAGENPVDVIVTGHPHHGLAGRQFRSRADALRALSAEAEPFFDAVRRVAADTGSTVREQWAIGPAVHVLATPAAILRFETMLEVRWVERDSEDAVRIDPIVEDGTGGQNTGGRRMIQAEDIWALGYRGEGIKIAIIDTGIHAAHEAFKNANGSTRIIAWKDWVSNLASPYDNNGHGTHVAGTAAGSTLFNDPIRGPFQEEGVAPRAQLLVSKFLNAGGSGSWANGINSINWAFANGADISSNSWGGGCSTSPPGDNGTAAAAAVRTTTDLGMLSAVAAGNSGFSGVLCPGRSESALTVGAVDQNMNIAGFSSRGPCNDPDTGTPNRICPDVVAKGVNVRSAWPFGSGYASLSGTSMATPHVAGAAALAEQIKRAFTGTGLDTNGREEEALFKATTRDLGAAGPDNDYGWGLVQLLNIYADLGPKVDAVLEGFEPSAPPALPQSVRFVATNNGYLTASELTIEVAVPDGYLFVPGPGFDPTDLRTLYSDPPPDEVDDSTEGLTILKYNVGTLGVDEAFEFTSTLAGTLPGSYEIRSTASYENPDGFPLTRTKTFTQTIGPPEL